MSDRSASRSPRDQAEEGSSSNGRREKSKETEKSRQSTKSKESIHSKESGSKGSVKSASKVSGNSSPKSAIPSSEIVEGHKADDPDDPENKLLPDSELYLIERSRCTTIFALLVMVNAIFIGVDTDLRATGGSDHALAPVMFAGEVFFFFAFLTELVLRLYADRCPGWTKSTWNWLDLVLVVFSAFDIIISTLMQSSSLGALSAMKLLKNLRLMKMLRILRMMKLVRILRLLRSMIMLLVSIVSAMRAMVWVMVLFLGILYMLAIITTEFLGIENKWSPLGESIENKDEYIDAWFGDLWKSMFTLYQMATLEGWATITRRVDQMNYQYVEVWFYLFPLYVLFSNTILMNVVLAVLIEKFFDVAGGVKSAAAGEAPADMPSWMETPKSLQSEEEKEHKAMMLEKAEVAAAMATGVIPESLQKSLGSLGAAPVLAMNPQALRDRETVLAFSEVFERAAQEFDTDEAEDPDEEKKMLVTHSSLSEAMRNTDFQAKLFILIPSMRRHDEMDLPNFAKKIYESCPKRVDREGLSKNEFTEACLAVRGEMSMNHFVTISQSLDRLERSIRHDLLHLNKAQRKMNRRFIKLRHRLRKVYHYSGAPRKMVEMMALVKSKQEQPQGAIHAHEGSLTEGRKPSKLPAPPQEERQDSSGETSSRAPGGLSQTASEQKPSSQNAAPEGTTPETESEKGVGSEESQDSDEDDKW